MTKLPTRDELVEGLREAYRQSHYLPSGARAAMNVWPDGHIEQRQEIGESYSEEEYYGRRPHDVTVCSFEAVTDIDPVGDFEYGEEDGLYYTPDGDAYTRDDVVELRVDEYHPTDEEIDGIYETLRGAFCLSEEA